MINWQETFLFPVRDGEARKQFLMACLVTLAGFIIPLLPTFVLMGYAIKIMRQVITERKSPSMSDWQQSDWSQMFMDGLRLFGAQLALSLPLILVMGCGFMTIMVGSAGLSITASSEDNLQMIAPISFLVLFIGLGLTIIIALLSLPYSVAMSAALPHTIAKNSLASAFEFKEWFPILRAGLGQFIIGYLFIMVTSYLFVFVIQFAMLTLVLICIVPFLMIPYTTYLTLVTYTVYAQAYALGQQALISEPHATA